MYDTIFSPQWLFDRCIEAQTLFIPLNIIVFLIIISCILFLFKKAGMSNYLNIVISSGLAVIIFPVVFFSSWIFGIFTCSAGYFWKGIIPAHKLHAKVRQNCYNQNKCPQSEKELFQLDPSLYSLITSNAKSKYSYNSSSGKYNWYVRPSKYYVATFTLDSFGVYKIPNLIQVKHWDDFGGTPVFQGKIDDLPK